MHFKDVAEVMVAYRGGKIDRVEAWNLLVELGENPDDFLGAVAQEVSSLITRTGVTGSVAERFFGGDD